MITLYQLLLHISQRKLCPMGHVNFRLWQQNHFICWLDLCIFNKRLRRLLEAVQSWECLGVLPRDPRAVRAGREATSSWEFVTHTNCTLVEPYRCVAGLFKAESCTFSISLHCFPLLFTLTSPLSFGVGSQPEHLSLLQLGIRHMNCVCGSQCLLQEFPVVSPFSCKMLATVGKWTAHVSRAFCENKESLNSSIAWKYLSHFDYWFFLSLQCLPKLVYPS